MRKLLLVTTLLAGIASFSSVASAQPKGGKSDDKAAPAAGGKVKTYDFSGDTIEGDLVKPEGATVEVRDFASHSSLIRIRKEFIAEILKSAEDL